MITPRYSAPSTASVVVRTSRAPDDRGQNGHAAQHEREERDLAGELREGEHAEEHHGHGGDRVGLEQVGRHPGAVAHVVADVVGDHGGVAGVVLGDPRLDLADEVGPDVGRLGEDAAAQAGEDGDERAAEAEADECVDGLLVGLVGQDQDAEVAGDAQQGKSHDQQPRHRAALERGVEGRRHAAARRLGDPGVGAHRDVHADEAGRAAEDAADHEADAGGDILEDRDQDRQRDGDHGDDRVLAVQIGLRALLHGARDLLHPVAAR